MHTPVLSVVAQRCHGALPEIVGAYTREVRVLPGYAAAAVTDEELQSTATRSLDLMLRLLSDEQVQDQLGLLSESIGRRRARQGLALDSLIRAVRMDFRFLWEVMRAEATADRVSSAVGGCRDHLGCRRAAHQPYPVGLNR